MTFKIGRVQIYFEGTTDSLADNFCLAPDKKCHGVTRCWADRKSAEESFCCSVVSL